MGQLPTRTVSLLSVYPLAAVVSRWVLAVPVEVLYPQVSVRVQQRTLEAWRARLLARLHRRQPLLPRLPPPAALLLRLSPQVLACPRLLCQVRRSRLPTRTASLSLASPLAAVACPSALEMVAEVFWVPALAVNRNQSKEEAFPTTGL